MVTSQITFLLSFLVTFQLLFVGLFLVTHRKGRRRNNILLGIILLMIGWNMADMTIRMSTFQRGLGFYQLLDDGFFLLYGPLFYTYVQMVIYKDYKISKWSWIHLLPYVCFTSFLIISFGARRAEPIGQTEMASLPWYIQVVSFSLYLHILIYLAFAYRSLMKYRKIIKNQFSGIDDINLNWLSFALITMVGITLLSLLHNFLVFFGNEYVYGISMFLLVIFIFYFVNRVILKALVQPEIFAGIEQADQEKYAGSNLTSDQAETYRLQLIEILEKEKLYLNSQLSITELADKLNISPKVLSQVINQSFQKNFFDFINSYRIKEAQAMLKHAKDDKLTILEVLYTVGFNSKSSFNTAFKKATGQTPTAYRKSLKD